MKIRTPLIVVDSTDMSKSDIEIITNCFKGVNANFQCSIDKPNEQTDITKYTNVPLLIFTENVDYYKKLPHEDRESVSVSGKDLASHPHALDQVKILCDMKFTNYTETTIVQHPSTPLGLLLKQLGELNIAGEVRVRDSDSKTKDLLIPASQTTLALGTIKSTFPLAYHKTLLCGDEIKKYYAIPNVDSPEAQYKLQALNTHLSKIKNTSAEASQITK